MTLCWAASNLYKYSQPSFLSPEIKLVGALWHLESTCYRSCVQHNLTGQRSSAMYPIPISVTAKLVAHLSASRPLIFSKGIGQWSLRELSRTYMGSSFSYLFCDSR